MDVVEATKVVQCVAQELSDRLKKPLYVQISVEIKKGTQRPGGFGGSIRQKGFFGSRYCAFRAGMNEKGEIMLLEFFSADLGDVWDALEEILPRYLEGKYRLKWRFS